MIKKSSPPPGEDVLEIPRSWKRHLHPRRGGHPGPGIEIAGTSEAEVLAPYAAAIETALSHRKTDPALAAAARQHLAGNADPLGAAVVAVVPESEVHSGEAAVRSLDAWITAYGLPFAVRAFVERTGVTSGSAYGTGKGGVVPPAVPGFDGYRLGDAAKRLRTVLAGAGDAAYREAVAVLAGLRTTPMRRMVAAYLVPTELDWVAECCALPEGAVPRELLLRSLGSAGHLEILGAAARISVSDCYYIENLVTLAEGVGPAIAPFMAEAFDRHHGSAPRRKGLLDVLGRLPSDEAFRLMLERRGNAHMRAALRDTMRRFPVRAVRVLAAAAAAGDATAGELLADHLRGGAVPVPPDLPAEARAVVEKLAAADGLVPEAAAGDLPRLLVDPPWARARPRREPVVVKGLSAPGRQDVVWAPGERDAWLATEIADPSGGGVTVRAVRPTAAVDATWERRIANIRAGVALDPVQREAYWQGAMLAKGPEELVRPALREWRPAGWNQRGLGTRNAWSPDHWLRPIIARFGLDALPVTLSFARARPARGAELLLPFLDGEVAEAMAGWLLRVPGAREPVAAWFARHGRAALPYLLPAALGKAGRARTAAEYALHFVAGGEGEDAVIAAARPHGERAVAAVEGLLSGDAEDLLPRKKAPEPAEVNVEALPQVLLRGGERALPVPAVRHLLTLLAMASSGEEVPGLVGVLEVCDERSLAEFGWALFRDWRERGAVAKEAWRFTALGRLGDDEAVRGLVPLIRAWPGEGGHHHAVRGLDVLALIGTDLALRELHAISQKARYKGLKQRAQEKVEEIAAARGLTPEQLGDRLVPDLGLDAAGTLVLDYGPRRFTAGFDETLRPHVVDELGRRRADLPKPGVRDDPALAPAAHRRYADLKKDVRAIAGLQIRRLELAMTAGRRWTPDEFTAFFVRHPLVWHIARRLVWLAEHGGTATAFRLAEDRTFADVADTAVALPDGAAVGIAHPLHLGDALDGWSAVFADYEILQPFPQLGRDVHALTDEEAAGGRLPRFEGATVPFGNVLGLERRGWHRGPVNSDGGIDSMVRPVARRQDGAWTRYVVVTLETGLYAGDVRASGDQTFEAVWIGADPAPERFSHLDRQDGPYRFGELDPVTASEVIADLEEATAR
ncbi:hypothetical protein GCM10009527_049530 [Actinomadura nitritigenes]|uniref:DUF4132 domain-containing protein n=1 Tax=Actinomadura nitritigenes TaxID=134602 RepID=A0ABS3RA81_9ACTN|nr:DUF4132 domain-containing protein [Actinomadura nitritigenes]MBO2442967.1 DUF4132 domain-containing protein [Actinomadura nitritigenes]